MEPGPLIDRLVALGALPRRPDRAAPLAGGYANRAWRLDLDGFSCVLKAFTGPSDNPLFPNLPDHEAAALRALEGLDIAPRLLAALPGADGPAVVLYGWVDGEPWRADVAAAARLLRRVHAVPPPRTMRALAAAPAAVMAQGDDLLSRASPPRRAELARLRPRVAPAPAPDFALVHTDCGPGNLIAGADGLRLIDWQCPGRGDPAEDLACFLSPAMMRLYDRPPLAPEAAEAFLAAYDDSATVARYRAAGVVFHWRTAAYCLWRAEALAGTRPDASRAYAEAFALERALLEAAA